MHKAGHLQSEFLNKSPAARKMAISRFLAKNTLIHHMVTHQAQHYPDEVHKEALAHCGGHRSIQL
jgi:hypothetical protein